MSYFHTTDDLKKKGLGKYLSGIFQTTPVPSLNIISTHYSGTHNQQPNFIEMNFNLEFLYKLL